MKTIKDILTENRESVISSLKYIFKVYDNESLKIKMTEFLQYAQENGNVEFLTSSKRVKTELKLMIERMAYVQKSNQPKQPRMKLADIMAGLDEIEKEKGNIWNPMQKQHVKNLNAFSSMSK